MIEGTLVGVTAPVSGLTRLLPTWDFRELHERAVAATPAEAYAAFRALRLSEMPLSRVLFALRSLPELRTGRQGLPTSTQAPLMDLMLDAGFMLLADTPDREVVFGTIHAVRRADGPTVDGAGDVAARAAAFAAYAQPGAVKIASTFLFTATGVGGTTVSTETRVLATDARSRRLFRAYWLLIRPFSGLIRWEWLRAIDRRTAPAARG